VLCRHLAALARSGHDANEFHRLIRQGAAIVVDDAAFHGRRPGRKWKLDSAWLFRRAYLEERACAAIAAETATPARSVVEMVRRLSNRLERRLLIALALPAAVAAAVLAGQVREGIRERVLEALRVFAAGEAGESPEAGDEASP